MSVISGVVGPRSVADGSTVNQRSTKNAGFVHQQERGKYAEAVLRGNCYNAQTAATGVAPGTALGTTAAFCLANPSGSGKNLIVMELGMGLISGTLGAGTVHIVANPLPTTLLPTGTAIVPQNRLIGSPNSAVAKPLTTATVITTAATQLGILCSLNEGVVATTAINNERIVTDVDGAIIVSPGCSLCLHATAAAGSTPLVVFTCAWEEVPIV